MRVYSITMWPNQALQQTAGHEWFLGLQAHRCPAAAELGRYTGGLFTMIGYDYRCLECAHEWVLFSKRFTLGLTVWGQIKYECFCCQTHLSIVATPDLHSWSAWRRNHEPEIARNESLSDLAQRIDSQLSKKGQFTPVELHFTSVDCPTCWERMERIWKVPSGEHLMKCPQCGEFSGEYDGSNGISIYGECVVEEPRKSNQA